MGDSTLVQQDVAMEMAKAAGVEKETTAILEATARGEISYTDSLQQRVALLKGRDADEIFGIMKNKLSFTAGATRLCATLKTLGYRTAVISGSFLPVAQHVQRLLELNYAFANVLEVDESSGQFTGLIGGPVITPQRKRNLLATMANVEGCEVQQTVAVGDSVNDIPMLEMAGLGIAFSAKPSEHVEIGINHTDLSLVLYLIGLSEQAVQRLSFEVKSHSRGPSVSGSPLCGAP